MGGLIILGNAPTNIATTSEVEGISGYTYGGTDPNDDSGTLQYVRVWHGGDVIGANNEINGITFAGVGDGTTVDHCEVAYNLDDGFEWFGGTVNAKYLSVLFCGDDSFDTDKGFQGVVQYMYTMLGSEGDHATELDSGYGTSDADDQPRSHPAFYSGTFIGGGTVDGRGSGEIMHLNDGTGGTFVNLVLVNPTDNGVYFDVRAVPRLRPAHAKRTHLPSRDPSSLPSMTLPVRPRSARLAGLR